MSKDVSFGNDARTQMQKGVNTLADAVRTTLGPRGRNVVIQNGIGVPHITKDGATVANSLVLEDPLENMGAALIKNAASKAESESGDGTTTTSVICAAFINEGMKSIAAGLDPTDLRRGINAAVEDATTAIKEMAIPCDSNDSIKNIATISANNDEVIGSLIADAMAKVGNDGIITIESGNGIDNELDIVDGMQFDRGYVSPYFADQQTGIAALENPLVLLMDKRVTGIQELVPILEESARQGKPLLIIAEDFEGEVLNTLVLNHLRSVLKVCAIKAPGFGDNRKAILRDLAVLLDGQVVSDETGITLEDFAAEYFGSANRVTIGKDNTTIVNGNGTESDIAARVVGLKTELANSESAYEQSKIEERIAKLSGGVGVIRVGGATEIEMKEKQDLFDDALGAAKAAAESGLVPGAGVTLATVANKIKGMAGSGAYAAGYKIALTAMTEPFRQIITNGGGTPEVILHEVLANDKDVPYYGYNSLTEKYENLVDSGVVDPAKAAYTGLLLASSIAAAFLTIDAAITDIPKDTPPMAPMPQMM